MGETAVALENQRFISRRKPMPHGTLLQRKSDLFRAHLELFRERAPFKKPAHEMYGA
jgi:hypothetical protein